jgi:hypothetical protein
MTRADLIKDWVAIYHPDLVVQPNHPYSLDEHDNYCMIGVVGMHEYIEVDFLRPQEEDWFYLCGKWKIAIGPIFRVPIEDPQYFDRLNDAIRELRKVVKEHDQIAQP